MAKRQPATGIDDFGQTSLERRVGVDFQFCGPDPETLGPYWSMPGRAYVQDKLREELSDARDHPEHDIPYEKLLELPILDAICRETLRLYVKI